VWDILEVANEIFMPGEFHDSLLLANIPHLGRSINTRNQGCVRPNLHKAVIITRHHQSVSRNINHGVNRGAAMELSTPRSHGGLPMRIGEMAEHRSGRNIKSS
jgi:hypothetical protein